MQIAVAGIVLATLHLHEVILAAARVYGCLGGLEYLSGFCVVDFNEVSFVILDDHSLVLNREQQGGG